MTNSDDNNNSKEPKKLWFCWMKLFRSDNHYTTALLVFGSS